MSSVQEFSHVAFAMPMSVAENHFNAHPAAYGRDVPHPSTFAGADYALVLVEASDSNVSTWDYRPVRDEWHVAAAGSTHSVLEQVCTTAAREVLGGMVVLGARSKRGFTKPERYIGHYRKVMESAVDFEVLVRAAQKVPPRPFCVVNTSEENSLLRQQPWTDELVSRGRLNLSTGEFIVNPISVELALVDLAWLCSIYSDGTTRFASRFDGEVLRDASRHYPAKARAA